MNAAEGGASPADEVSQEPGKPRQGTGLRESVAEAGRRIEDIIDAAERVASEIRAQAEAEAERLISARREEADRMVSSRREEADRLLGERTAAFETAVAGLTAKADRLSDDARGLGEELKRAVDRLPPLGEEPEREAVEPSPPAASEPKPVSGPRPVAYPGTAPQKSGPPPQPAEEDAGDVEVSEQAVLRATQMAVTGTGREEIERTLRSEFDVADPGPFVDELLGPDAA